MVRWLLPVLSFLFVACALPPVDLSGQNFVPEDDISAIRYVKEGVSFMSVGRYLDAEIKFQKALLLQPNSTPIRQNIAVSHFMQERYEEALKEFQTLSSEDPLLVSLMVWVGKTEAELGQNEAAIDLFKRSLELSIERNDPIGASAIARSLGSLYYQLGLESEAICFSSTSYELYPVPLETYRHARLLLGTGYPENSARLITNYLTVMGGAHTRELAEVLALSQFAAGKLDEAMNSLKEAMLLSSDDPDMLLEVKLSLITFLEAMKAKGSDPKTVEYDEDAADELLDDPRLDGPIKLFWPKRFLDSITTLKSQRLGE